MSGRDSLGLHLTRPSPGAYQESATAPRLWPAERTMPEQPGLPQRGLRFFAALLGLLGISATVTLAVPGMARASAVPAPARDGPTCPTEPAPDGPAGSSSVRASGNARANRSVLALNGLGPYGGQDDEVGARAQPERAAAPGRPPPATLLATSSGPIVLALDCGHPEPTPTAPGAGRTLPRIPAEPGQPLVAQSPVHLTGSTMTMTGLRIEGIVELPTAGGTLRAVKFSVDRVMTDDARLRAPGPAGRTLRVATDQLTLTGEVAVYATRFVGRLPGVTITLSPDLPLPPGIATTSAVPVTFSGVAVDLAYLQSHSLTARPALKLNVN